MLVFNLREIGNRMFFIRKQKGLTQAETAEAAGLSDRTYADIERGNVNMRLETFLGICKAFHVTPNDILVDEVSVDKKSLILQKQEQIWKELNNCSMKEKETALALLTVYLQSL